MRNTRYCRSCRAASEHFEADPIDLPWRWAVLYPAVWLFDRFVDPPGCVACLRRVPSPALGRLDPSGSGSPIGVCGQVVGRQSAPGMMTAQFNEMAQLPAADDGRSS